MLWWTALSVAAADTCAAWGSPTAPVEVAGGLVSQSSGLAASRARPGVLYTHDDKNGPRDLFAYSLDGVFLGAHEVKGAVNEDWEGLEAAPCPDGGDCIYVGDIGDNDRQRREIRVLVVREPERDGASAKVVRTLTATWPGGPRDSEALLVHPCTGDVYVVTREGSTDVAIHRFPDDAHRGRKPLEEVAVFPLDGAADSPKITGGSFDADGDRVVLRNESHVWEWAVDPERPEAHWSDPPTELSLPLNESEAITYTLDGDLVSSSEGFPMTLATLPCDDLGAPTGTCVFEPEAGCRCSGAPTQPGPTGIFVAFLMLYSRRRLDT